MDRQGGKRRLSPAPAHAPSSTYPPPPNPGTQVAPSPPQTQWSPSMVRPSPLLPTMHSRLASYPELYASSTAAAAPSAPTVTQRATVACDHCRRSKIRCKHKDCTPPCEHCRDRGLKCVFSPPAVQNKGQRRESDPRAVDNIPKKRRRTHNLDYGAIDSPGIDVRSRNPLTEEWLTPEVWGEMFDIYEKHFASDLPFLHRRRFLEPLQNPGNLPAPSIPLQLGLLTLTICHHSIVKSRFFADKEVVDVADEFAQATMNSLLPKLYIPSVDRTQALLLVGYHRWTDLKGRQAWTIFRHAGSFAQLLALHKDEVKNTKEENYSDRDESEQQERFIDREIERRTFWSCFIMDQYTSCIGRQYLFNVKDIETQLPCSDAAFHSGLDVKTRLLGESDVDYAERRQTYKDTSGDANKVDWECGKDEAELGLYIQAVVHFAKVTQWSIVDRGRRAKGEQNPWEKKGSRFYELEKQLEALQTALPKPLRYTQRNTTARIYSKTSRIYVEIHAAYTLCTIALYREYLAFAPWDLSAPIGPLDAPLLEPSHPEDDRQYWIKQARACFGAAKDFADLLKACKVANCLVDSPIVGFATYIVAWCAVYCFYFPNMDPDKVLSFTTPANRAKSSGAGPELWGLLKNILLDSGKRYAMHNRECGQLNQLIGYYHKTEARLKELAPSPGSTGSGQSGGLDVYTKSFEKGHKLFGSDEDVHYRKSHRGSLCLPRSSDSSDQGTMATGSPPLAYRPETPATDYSSVPQPQYPRGRKAPSEAASIAPTIPSLEEHMANESPGNTQSNKLPPIIDPRSSTTPPNYNHHSGLALQPRQYHPQPNHMNGRDSTRHVMPESQWRPASVHKENEKERVQMVTDGQCDARMLDMRGIVAGSDDLLPQSYGRDPVHNWLDHLPLWTYGFEQPLEQPLQEELRYIAHGFPDPSTSSFSM